MRLTRWILGWLFFLGVATGGTYVGMNEFVARQQDDGYAMRLLGARLGSAACSHAARDLVAAGDGAAAAASAELRATYDRAARNVVQACADA